jgi:hypothetical protein
MFCKFGKEKKVLKNKEFRIKYGTVDALKLNSIYLVIESWVIPTEELNYESYIRLMRRQIILKLNQHLDQKVFNKHFIVDLDLRSSGMSTDRKSFMLLEITLYPKIKPKFNSEILLNNVDIVSNIILESLKQNKFKFNSNKNG